MTEKHSMRYLFAFIFAMTLLTPPNAHAATSDLLFGAQTHSYTVVMRGNGEAIVYGKLSVPNASEDALDHLRLNLNISDATDFVAYQEIAIDRRTSDYKKMDANLLSSGVYDLQFPLAIDPNGQTEIIFAYSSMQYTEKSLGLFTYTFKTPSVEARIERVAVSVSTDSDLFIKGGESRVDYEASYDEAAALSAGFSDSGMLEESVRYIGSGNVREHATNLQPNESFTVDGTYGEQQWRVHLSKILWTTLGAIAAGALAYVIVRKAKLRLPIASPAPHARQYGLLSALSLATWTAFLINVDTDFIEGSEAAAILSVVLVGLVYLGCALMPSLIVGTRHGVQAGMKTFGYTILFLIIGLFITLAFTDTQSYPEFID